MHKSTRTHGKDTKYRTSRSVGDATPSINHVASAPRHSAPESSSQVERSETTVKSPTTETRSYLRSSRQARKKAQKEEYGDQYISDESSRAASDNDEETKPGAYSIVITGLKSEDHPVEENEPLAVLDFVDPDVKDRAMLVEADLAPELTSAELVNVQEEEEVILKKRQYRRVLWFAMVFHGMAILGNIAGFVLLFASPPLAFGPWYTPYWGGLVEAACLFFVATVVISIPFMRRCCRSYIPLEKYAPDDKQLLRETYIASGASLCLFFFVAMPILRRQVNLQWLGYALMAWFFAGTVFTFSRVRLLRRSKETRPKTSKIFWVLFSMFFLGLTGATIWRCRSRAYPDCTVENPYWIGDGDCNGQPYSSEECGFDGGDCIKFLKDYPKCNVSDPFRISDGTCDGGDYYTLECGYDGGDCSHGNATGGDYPDCVVPDRDWIGDGFCDGIVYGTVECGFDGGDCLAPGQRCRRNGDCASEVCNSTTKVCDAVIVVEGYPNCSVAMPKWIGDGECDGGYYASKECGFDGGDCLELGEPCEVDEECASGLCSENTKLCYLGILRNYPDCIVDFPRRIGDGKCDGGPYASEVCGSDGGDC